MRKRLAPIELDNYKPLRDIVFEALREAVIAGQLRPGERLMEVQLAEELGVSRTPVREAIRKLELEGFVIMVPRKGAYVSDMSIKDVTDVFEIRRALEGLAAELAAERMTDEELEELERILVCTAETTARLDVLSTVDMDTGFHQVIYEASRNEKLSSMLYHLREQIQRFRTQSLSRPGRLKRALVDHRGIVDALRQRDTELARKLAEQHIEDAESELLAVFQENGEEEEES
ncbi:MAG: GntR family transcriptional regulator [Firmicutes bacterium]|jgi:DNA-binding GntR family transcriptional regulator|nr:GntR family transcriptional regulator [Bacillota bacterium]